MAGRILFLSDGTYSRAAIRMFQLCASRGVSGEATEALIEEVMRHPLFAPELEKAVLSMAAQDVEVLAAALEV